MTDLYNEILDFQSMNFNREGLISDYVDRVLDDMSTKDMVRILGDQLQENLQGYNDEELLKEVREHYPELVEDVDEV